LGWVPDDEEDNERKLRGQIEHTALYNDAKRSPASSKPNPHGPQVVYVVRGVIPDVPSNEDGNNHVCAQWEK